MWLLNMISRCFNRKPEPDIREAMLDNFFHSHGQPAPSEVRAAGGNRKTEKVITPGDPSCVHDFENVRPIGQEHGKGFEPIGDDNWYAIFRDRIRCKKCGHDEIQRSISLI